MDEQCCETDAVMSYLDKENEIVSVCTSTDNDKHINNKKLTVNENEAKSSKILSLLDSYCNNLNESSDFVECEIPNKFKNASQKNEEREFQKESEINEPIVCDICKEDITPLDLDNRGIHVNKCIDKQVLSTATAEVITNSSTNEDVFILECPLCFKHFSSPELRSNHVKKCGRSKGLSLQSILKALELQERHALERISLGLPAKPVKPVKIPKVSINKKAIVQPKSKTQSDIQLAKALSLSLTSSSQQSNTESNEQITSLILKPPTVNQRPGKKTKKNLSSTPLLVLRSDEDRKKLLLEKVESILTSTINPELTSSPGNEKDITSESQNITDQEAHTLWHMSSKSSEKYVYYVEELLDWIKPSDVEMGTKLLHLSQIPGHEIVTQLPCNYTFNAPEEKSDEDVKVSTVSSTANQYSASVIESLSSLVASSWMSDVDIYTSCGTVIPAHKLLLAIRCPPLKEDFNFYSGKEHTSLKWETISFDAALQFLNFIYTGNLDIKKDLISDLSFLANKYEVFDLQALLQTNSTGDIIPEIESNQKVLTSGKENYLPSSSFHFETSENAEGFVYESQEDMNMDLEIVYNCINHTLKPSQIINSQSSILNDSVSNCSDKTNILGNTSPKSMASASSVIFNIDDNEHENDIDELPSKKDLACNIFSAKNDGSSSPVIFDVNDSENETGDHASQNSFVCNVSPENDVSPSPLIFDVNDSENDADRLSDHETSKCSRDYPHKSPSLPSNIEKDPLDLNIAESNSSNDSVKFLQSSFVAHNSYNTPEKIRKSNQISPKNSMKKISFSPTALKSSPNSPVLCQDKYEENRMHCESYQEPLIMKSTELKPLSISCSQVSNDKKSLKNAHVELESPVTSYSQRILSDFHSKCDNETSGVTEINTLESFNHVLSVNVSPEVKSSRAMSLFGNENIINSVSGEDDDITSKLSFKSSSYLSGCHSATKSGVDIMQKSLNRTSASPEVLICDSNSDSESQKGAHYQTSSLSDYCMNFSQKVIKSDTCSPANSSLSSNKSAEGDKVFESFQYFAHEISTYGEDDYPILNNSLECVEENSSSSRINALSSASPKKEQKTAKEQKKHIAPTTDCSQPSKISVHARKEKTCKTATPSNKLEMEQPRFQFSDSPVTPLPDYKSMMTPEIRQALKRIGVKPLPRKKALAILSHVYNETHPLFDTETNTVSSCEAPEILLNETDKVTKSKKRKQTTQNSEKPVKKQQKENNSKSADLASPESDESDSENPEWLGCVPEMSFSQSNHDSPTKPSKDDIESIKLFIQSSEELYHNVLNYIPLNLVEFHQDLKKNDIKISIQKLMDFLDEQCITFTCPRKEEYKKKQTARAQRFRKKMIAKMSQQTT